MKLIFVYNAGSGFFNVAADMAHKIFSPATYPCSLCDITYGIFKVRPEWAEFVNNTAVPFEFLHNDEFFAAYKQAANFRLPVILSEMEGRLDTLIPAEALNSMKSVAELKAVLLEKLNQNLNGLINQKAESPIPG
ncbi:MAG: hypothetical protein ABIO24_06300 [Saprospiraceae bacterium]